MGDFYLTLLKLHTKLILFGSGMLYSPCWSSTQSEFYLDEGCFTYLIGASYKVGFIWIRDGLLSLLKLHKKWVLFGSGMLYLTEAPYKVGFIWIRDILLTLLNLHTKWVLFGWGIFTLLYWSPHKVNFIWIRDVLLTLQKLHTKWVLFGSGMFYLHYWSFIQSEFYLDQGWFTYLTEASCRVSFIWIRDGLLTLLKFHTKWVLFGSGMFYLPYWSFTQSEFYLDQGCFTYLTEAPYKVRFFGSGMFYLPYWSSIQSGFYLD